MKNGFKYYPITETSEIPEQVGELPRESFIEKYNELVACLNNEIEALYSLYEAYGVKGFLDAEIKLKAGDMDNFRIRHKELFDLHSEHYEEYVSMEEDLIIADHKKTSGNNEGGEDGEHGDDLERDCDFER